MTNEEIDTLIRCKKRILEASPKDYRITGANKRKDCKAQSIDEKHEFRIFLRKNLDFQENFSVGLVYKSEEGKQLILLRMNGNRGETVENPWRPSPHFGYHIHMLTSDEIEKENFTDPKLIETTDKYNSFEGAIR